MQRLIKYIVGRTYRPLLIRYLSGTTNYRYKNIRLQIPPEVFHPGFFSSTQLLLKYMSTFSLAKKKLLELGAGSGLISIDAAKRGANVVASDINPIAVEALKRNKYLNKVELTIIESDLFQQIPSQTFDIIAINPPYYKKKPVTNKDHAWYCGENGEYFNRLFRQLKSYLHPGTIVLMILCDSCDLAMIENFAGQEGFKMTCILKRRSLIEENYIYQIVVGNA